MASYTYIKLYQESINKWKFEKKFQIGYLEFNHQRRNSDQINEKIKNTVLKIT